MGKSNKHLQSQGLIKMAYPCSNVSCLMLAYLATKTNKKRFKKIRLHIFDDVGVAAAELQVGGVIGAGWEEVEGTSGQERGEGESQTHLSCSVQLGEGFAGDAEELGHGVEGLALGVVDLVPHLEVLQARHGLCRLDARDRRTLRVKRVAELDHLHHKCLEPQE